MVVSPKKSERPVRDIADFFRPYARSIPQTVPQKRTSPYADRVDYERDDDGNDNNDNNDRLSNGVKRGPSGDTVTARPSRPVPKTPVKSVSFKNVTPSTASTVSRNIFSPTGSGASLPIRSPRVDRTQNVSPTKIRQRTLFETASPPKPRPNPFAKPDQNASFALSDVSERSQSIVKDGKVIVVLDSDGEDDTDSIESLADIIGRGKGKPENAIEGSIRNGNTQVSGVDTGYSSNKSGSDSIRNLQQKQRSLKFDLSAIMDDHFDDIQVTEQVNRARAESDDDESEDNPLTDMDKKLLADMVLNGRDDVDADDVNRVLTAVERTEALTSEKSYSFFDSRGMSDRRDTLVRSEFPEDAIPNGLWLSGDVGRRTRMFLSGIMAEKAAAGQLSDVVLDWVFEEAVQEQRMDLQQAYLRTLQNASHSWTRLRLTASMIQSTFANMGAARHVIRDNEPIESRNRIVHRQGSVQSSLHLMAVIQTLTTVCADLDMLALSKLTSMILRLALDSEVMSNNQTCEAVEDMIETLLDLPDFEAADHVYNRLISDAANNLHDVVLQARLLSHIRAGSWRASRLRQALAGVFLIGPEVLDSVTNISNLSLAQLTEHINTSSKFTITQRSSATANDYAVLTASVAMIDVAIGSGTMSDYEDIDTVESNVSEALKKPGLYHHHHHPPPDLNSTVKSFNADIDALANSIHSIFTSIKDSGASHMRRTEAKDALQALEYRLLYQVRHGVRKKKHVFDTVGPAFTSSSKKTAGKKSITTNTIITTKSQGKKNYQGNHEITSKTDGSVADREDGNSNNNSKNNIERKPRPDLIIGMDGKEYRERERSKEVMGRFLNRFVVKQEV